MTVTAPPRAPESEDERDLEERVAELEALIEEARRRARRRRAVYAAVVLIGLAAAATASFDIGGGGLTVAGSIADGSSGRAGSTAGNGRWGPSHGPEGGDVQLAVDPRDPRIVYAAGSGVVFKTTNAGRAWRRVTGGQLGGRASALAVDPARSATVYFATERGVRKTSDGGRTWRWVNAGLFDGETARRREHRLVEGFAERLVVDRHRPGTLYLVTATRGLFRTTDGGARWILAGPRQFRVPGYHAEVAIDPSSPGAVYASWSTFFDDSPAHLYRSADGGSTWQPIGVRGRHPWFGSLAVDPHRAGRLYAAGGVWGRPGLWRSDDGGSTWWVIGLASQRVTSIQIDPGPRATVFATTEIGVFTNNGGVSWRRLGAGTLGGYASVVVAQGPPDTLYGTADGVVKSIDGGRTWRSVNSGLVATGVEALVFAHGSSSALAAGTWQGVHTSADGGGSWRPARSAPKPTRIASLAAVEQRRGTVVYAGTRGFGVFKSANGGRSWQRSPGLSAEVVTALAIDPKHPDTAYAGSDPEMFHAGAASRGVYRTADGGRTWERSTLDAGVRALAIDALDPDTLFAAASAGLFRSADGGRTWGRVARGDLQEARGLGIDATGDGFHDVVLDPANPAIVYGTTIGTVWKSVDGGDTWARANAGLPGVSIDALAIDPRDPRILYLAGDGGVYRSTNGARSWRRFERGLQGIGVRALAVAPDGRTVFAGTGGRGVVSFDYDR